MEIPEHVQEGWVIGSDGEFEDPALIPPPPQPLTFENLQAKQFISQMLGIPFEITPAETQVLSIAANLSPIADGQEWRAGLNLVVGTIVTEGSSNFIVRVGHISQPDWNPKSTPALFKQIRGQYTEWVQPQGAHDAYVYGDRVLFGGHVWRSVFQGANIWPPGSGVQFWVVI